MADVFTREDAERLLLHKTIFFIGDSNVRALYKDVVQLVTLNDLIAPQSLKNKLEDSFNGDRLVAKGQKSNGRDYREERVFELVDNGNVLFAAYYFFITSCYSQYVENIFGMMQHVRPDVIVYNSCLWDLSRWGPNSIEKHRAALPEFVARLQELIPRGCYFIWLTALPLSPEIRGGFLLQQLDFLKRGLRLHVLDANQLASRLMREAGFDVLDLHYYLGYQLDRREEDGIHWHTAAVRYLTCLFLTRLSLAWDVALPNRFASLALQQLIDRDETISGRPKDFQDNDMFQSQQLPQQLPFPSFHEQNIFMPDLGQVPDFLKWENNMPDLRQVPDFLKWENNTPDSRQVPDFLKWENNCMINPDTTPNPQFDMGHINSSTSGGLTDSDQWSNFSSNDQIPNLNNPPQFYPSPAACNINLNIGFNMNANFGPVPNGFPNMGGNDSLANMARISYFPNVPQFSSGNQNDPSQSNFNPFSQVANRPNRRYQKSKRGFKNKRQFRNKQS